MIVGRFVPALQATYNEGLAGGSVAMVKSLVFNESSVKFDVERTDSMISPLVGVIYVRWVPQVRFFVGHNIWGVHT